MRWEEERSFRNRTLDGPNILPARNGGKQITVGVCLLETDSASSMPTRCSRGASQKSFMKGFPAQHRDNVFDCLRRRVVETGRREKVAKYYAKIAYDMQLTWRYNENTRLHAVHAQIHTLLPSLLHPTTTGLCLRLCQRIPCLYLFVRRRITKKHGPLCSVLHKTLTARAAAAVRGCQQAVRPFFGKRKRRRRLPSCTPRGEDQRKQELPRHIPCT